MRLRHSVRALILDPEDHVLLVRFHWDGLDIADGFWANPGGGIEPGETRLHAMRRELYEETGLAVEALGPEVWTKTAVFPMTQWDGQVDHIHLYRTERFDPAPAMSPAQLAAENLRAIRWWSPKELTTPDVTFSPRSLPALLSRLRDEGVPAHPIELDGF
jgi:8-oxo-dGTP diphosphatase